jgi:hypothetical protein
MGLTETLDALRALVQVDVAGRGLTGAMFTHRADDLADAGRELARADGVGVGIITGFFIPGPDRPETDGPPGAIFLARCLAAAGLRPRLMSEPECHAALRTGLDEVGLDSPVTGFADAPPRLIAIERVGPARDGRCYTMRGIDITDRMADVEHLFRGRRTVGIGDGGNEIGMGALPAGMIAANIPRGETIACRVPTDHLIVCGVSNWGAWALGVGTLLAAGIAPDLDLDLERRVLQRMVTEGGLIDGVTGRAELTVDGLTWDAYIRPLAAMKEMLS